MIDSIANVHFRTRPYKTDFVFALRGVDDLLAGTSGTVISVDRSPRDLITESSHE